MYLLHDKNSQTTGERVEWTAVRNLMSDDPELAWRIMAATAMDQDRLKEQAGVPKTGRKSNKSVLHMSLAWHPDEADSLTSEDMLEAVDGAIAAIGADDRQILIVAHNDEDHPHVHILCNRVSPENGVMLSSSNDRLKLSEWAQAYEEARGEILCEQRVENNQRRKEGEYVKGKRNESRHIIEAERVMRDPANDNSSVSTKVKNEQEKLDEQLAQKSRLKSETQKRAWIELEATHKELIGSIKQKAIDDITAAKTAMAEKYRPLIQSLKQQFGLELQAYDTNDQSLKGRLKNTWQAVSLVGQDAEHKFGQKVSRIFQVLSNKDARRDEILKDQQYRKNLLRSEQRKEFQTEKAALSKIRDERLNQQRADYLENRNRLIDTQNAENLDVKAEWTKRTQDRNQAFQADTLKFKKQFGEASGGGEQTRDDIQSARDALIEDMAKDYERYARRPSNDFENDM